MSYENGNGVMGPRMVGYQLSQGNYEYLMRILELGALEGPLGEMRPNEALRPIFEALHHVMAGGEVDVKVTRRGNPDIVNDLNRRLEKGTAEANEINRRAGFYVTAAS